MTTVRARMAWWAVALGTLLLVAGGGAWFWQMARSHNALGRGLILGERWNRSTVTLRLFSVGAAPALWQVTAVATCPGDGAVRSFVLPALTLAGGHLRSVLWSNPMPPGCAITLVGHFGAAPVLYPVPR